MTEHTIAAGLLLALCLSTTCKAQELLAWDTTPGTSYELSWELVADKTEETELFQVNSTVRSLERAGRTEQHLAVELTLQLVAPVQSGTVPVLAGDITHLAVSSQRHGLRLEFEHTAGRALQSRIDAVPGFPYDSPDQEQADRIALEDQLDSLREDVTQGLRLVLAPGERLRLERNGAAGVAQPTHWWKECYLQPALPAPLTRGAEWGAPAEDWVGLVQGGGASLARYKVQRLTAKRAELRLSGRDGLDKTDLSGGPGAKIADRSESKEEVRGRVVFDRRARHLDEASRTASRSLTTTSVVNGYLMSREDLQQTASSRVTLRRLKP